MTKHFICVLAIAAAFFLNFTCSPLMAQDGMCYKCGFPANGKKGECKICASALPNDELKKEKGANACDIQLFPDSSKKLLQEKDLSSLTKKELEIARNEIYARHGWIFDRELLAEYFSYKSWYKPESTHADRKVTNAKIMKALSPIEIKNIAAISRAEKKAGSAGAAEEPDEIMAAVDPAPAKPEPHSTSSVSVNHDASPSPAPGAKKKREDIVVCIDPGHPSEVSDANEIQNATTEVSVNWTISKRLGAELEKRGIKTIFTRNAFRKTTSNRARAEIANDAGSAVMLRLHCDSGGGNGITFYYPDRQGKVKNDVGPSEDVIKSSKEAAEIINEAASAVLSSKIKVNGIRGDSKTLIGGRQGALTGSIYSKVPAVTVEMIFLSDKKDASFIKSEEGQKLMTDALADGICAYLASIKKK